MAKNRWPRTVKQWTKLFGSKYQIGIALQEAGYNATHSTAYAWKRQYPPSWWSEPEHDSGLSPLEEAACKRGLF